MILTAYGCCEIHFRMLGWTVLIKVTYKKFPEITVRNWNIPGILSQKDCIRVLPLNSVALDYYCK
jgi:hypothetical protein